MRVLLLSDTHGAVDARIAALARGCDLIVHAGDVGNAAVLATLCAAAPRVLAVRGNNDVPSKWPDADVDVLQSLGETSCTDLPGGQLVVIHGDRIPPGSRHRRLRERFPAARAVVYGHSHHLVVDQDASLWILNPGAAGRTRTFGGPSCLLLRAGARRWQIEPRRFPLPAVVQAAGG